MEFLFLNTELKYYRAILAYFPRNRRFYGRSGIKAKSVSFPLLETPMKMSAAPGDIQGSTPTLPFVRRISFRFSTTMTDNESFTTSGDREFTRLV